MTILDKKGFCLLLAVLLLMLAQASASQDDTPFIRMDRDDPGAWKGELDSVRLLTGHLYEFGPVNDKYGIDPDFVPSDEGLSTLNISGSAQFSEPQFARLAETLRQCANEKRVIIVDLRQESHGLVNGIPISWYGSHNWANAGMTLEAIEKDEQERFGAMVGSTIKAYGREGDSAINETEIRVERFMTEKELVESEGFEYYRLPVQDHTWPTPDVLDTFIAFVKELDCQNAWLHFHCQAGKGRTGILMMVYDMMMNPQVPLEDVVVRQTMLGGSYPLYTEDSDNYKVPHYAMKASMTPLFYEYVQQQHDLNYEVPWSQWLTSTLGEVDNAA